MSTYHNPIIPGFHPDPSVCRVGHDYYLVTSSFEYFPGVPLFHSDNLVDWEQIGHVLTRESQLPLKYCRPSGGIFAPTIRHHNGRFYMVTTNTNNAHKPNGNFYVWTDDIRGEWSEPVWVGMPGIDPDLFFDSNGDVWFSCTGGQSRIDLETGKLIGGPTVRWPGTGGTAAPEAPHIYRIGDWYFTMLAEGGTERGHMVTIARSRNIGGPYESCPHNPILSHRSMQAELQSTGHGDMFEDMQGKWWMVFLATRPVGYPPVHLLGRETCLAPVTWSDDGWPVVNQGNVVPLNVTFPGLPEQKPEWREWHDDFSGSRLKPEWNFLRNPDPDTWSLSANPGALTLRCSPVSLDDTDSPAWVGRRLQHFETEQLVELDFNPGSGREEAGVSLFLQRKSHYDIFLTLRNGRRVLVVRRLVGSLSAVSEPCYVEEGPVKLSILTDRECFDLGFMSTAGRISLAKGEAKFLSTEIGGRFTGLFVALFAGGEGSDRSNASYAIFRHFKYISC